LWLDESALLAHTAASRAVPTLFFIIGESAFPEFNRVKRANVSALLTEGAELGIPLKSKITMTVHAASTFFPAVFTVTSADASHS